MVADSEWTRQLKVVYERLAAQEQAEQKKAAIAAARADFPGIPEQACESSCIRRRGEEMLQVLTLSLCSLHVVPRATVEHPGYAAMALALETTDGVAAEGR